MKIAEGMIAVTFVKWGIVVLSKEGREGGLGEVGGGHDVTVARETMRSKRYREDKENFSLFLSRPPARNEN